MSPGGFVRVAVALAVTVLAGTAASADALIPSYVRQLTTPLLLDQIGQPQAVTADPVTSEVFVCDSRKNRIVIFDPKGLFDFEIPGGDVFSAPIDLAVDAEGYLLVLATHQRHRALLELDFDGLFLREIELTGLDPGEAEPNPTSVALSPDGSRIYLLDTSNDRLWVADRSGALLRAVDLAPQVSGEERLDFLLGRMDVYGDSVLVAVPSEGAIRVFDLDGELRHSYGSQGATACELTRPMAAALDVEGDLWIVDQQRMVLVQWSTRRDRCVGESLGIGERLGLLYFPSDLSLDSEGRLYIAQAYQSRVQQYRGFPPGASPVAAEPAGASTEPARGEPRSESPEIAATLAVEPPAIEPRP